MQTVDMPKRPRSHVLETESRHYFGSIIPKEWLFREEHPDYGIDGSIEVFDERGETTGLRFYVQLKATDSEHAQTQRTIRFKTSTQEYWHQQKHPTLLIQYCSAVKCVYWAWHFDRRISEGKTRSTASLKFEDGDIWSGESPGRIHKQLSVITRLKDHSTTLPISIRMELIECDEDFQLDEVLRDEFGKLADLIDYGSQVGESSDHIAIKRKGDSLCVDFEGLTSLTFPFELTSPTTTAHDILVAVGIGFANLGKRYLVGKILPHVRLASLIAHPYFSIGLAKILVQEKEFPLLRELVGRLFALGAPYTVVSVYAFTPTFHPGLMPDNEKSKHESFLINHLKKVRSDIPHSYGLAAYNTGEYLLATGKLRLAFRHFSIALKADAHYAKSRYLRFVASGILFRLGRYRHAAIGYTQGLRMEGGKRPDAMALLADALVHCGKLGAAAFWYQKAFEMDGLKSDHRIGVFRLQFLAVVQMIDVLGARRVQINVRRALLCLNDAMLAESEQPVSTVLESLHYNPASAQAWGMLRQLYFNRRDQQSAQICALIAACVSDMDVSAWMDLVISCLFFDSEIGRYALTVVLNVMPAFLAEEAYRRVKQADSQKQKQFFRELGQRLSQLPQQQPERVVRLRDMMKPGEVLQVIEYV